MNITRTIAIQSQARIRLADMFSSAKMFGPSSATMNESYTKILAQFPKGTPGYVRSYLDGYRAALTEDLYRNHLVFGGFIGDVFHSTHSDRADYYQTLGVEPSAYADNGLVKKRGHYWQHNLNPFFIG